MSARKIIIQCKDFLCDTFIAPEGDQFFMVVVGLRDMIDASVGDEVLISVRKGPTDTNSIEWTNPSSIIITRIKANYQGNVVVRGVLVKSSSAQDSTPDIQYLKVAKRIQDQGSYSGNRTDTNTFKMFGTQMIFDLRKGIPLLTSKKINTDALIKELLWFARGETNTNTLGSKIWDQWATEEGELGPVYGAQWRRWPAFNFIRDPGTESSEKKREFLLGKGYLCIGKTMDDQDIMFKNIDQLADILHTLRNNPNDRRMIVTAWNPANNPDSSLSPEKNAELGMQALPPCHTMWQVGTTPLTYQERLGLYINTLKFPTVENINEIKKAGEQENTVIFNDEDIPEYYIDLQLYQRSADFFVGVPFNIASYSILLCLIAHTVGMVPRNFIHTFGDYHLYENHIDQIKQQFEQEQYPLPTLNITSHHNDLAQYLPEDIELVNYQHSAYIKAEVAK
jgi:thymidylate synthase